MHLSIVAQLGKMRMTVPSRASTCNHLQCFDVQMFLQMNEKKPTWTCPVCDKPAEFNKLIIDGYVFISRSSSAQPTVLCSGSDITIRRPNLNKGRYQR